MKKVVYESIGIIAVAALFGLVYNFFTPKPLPLIKEKLAARYVSDSQLDSMLAGFDKPDQGGQVPVEIVKDTIRNVAALDTASRKDKPAKDTANRVQTDSREVKKTALSLTYNQFIKYMNRPDVVLVDARRDDVYEKGHIGKAINIYPLDEQEAYFSKLTQLPANKTIIVYCDGGECELSHHVANDLLNFGFGRVWIYTGGWEEWTKKHNG